MDMPCHKIEECYAFKNNIQDLINAGVITINLLNQKHENSDWFKVHQISSPNPCRYSHNNVLVIFNLGPSDLYIEGSRNENSYEP